MRWTTLTRTTVPLVALLMCLGVTGPAFAMLVPGIDTSHYQHAPSLNWNAVRAEGVRFAFLKATEGQTFKDPYFAADWQATSDAGIYRGAYHFARPSIGTARAQAQYFASVIGPQTGPLTLPPVLDLETTGGLGRSDLVNWTDTFLTTLEKLTGRTPIIYVSPAFWEDNLGNSNAFTRYPLWVAHYGVSSPRVPGGWPTWTFWQTTSDGSVSGISGRVDKDLFNGSLAQLRRLAGGAPPATPPATVLSLTANHVSPMTGQRIRLTGQLLTAGGAPVADRTVTLSRTLAADDAPTDLKSVTTDSAGHFIARTRVRAAGSYAVRFAGDDEFQASTSPPVAVGLTPRATTLALAAGATHTLAGTAISFDGSLTSGKQLAGQTVALMFRERRTDAWAPVAQATTDDSGAFSTSVAPTRTGVYRAQFLGDAAYAGSSSPRVRVSVELNPTTLTAHVDQGATYRDRAVEVRGRLRSGRTPIAGQLVSISAAVDGSSSSVLAQATTDDQGRYVADVVASQPLTLQASTPESDLYQAALAPTVAVTIIPPESTTLTLSGDSGTRIVLHRGDSRAFRGRLLDSTGAPLNDRRIRMWRRIVGDDAWTRERKTRTDADGTWEITGDPRHSVVYRFVFPGGDRYAGARTAVVRIRVRSS